MSSVHRALNSHYGCELDSNGNMLKLPRISDKNAFPNHKYNNQWSNKVAMIHSQQLPLNTLVPFSRGAPTKSRGTGFFVRCGKDNELYLLTNHHVVNASCQTACSFDWSSKELYPCDIVALDPQQDFALLKPRQLPAGKTFEEIEVGDELQLNEEHPVHAVGFPMGMSRLKVTSGTFSGFEDLPGKCNVRRMVQHCAPVNPGNSGGPLIANINRKLYVVAVNNCIMNGNELCFGQPASAVKRFLDSASSQPNFGKQLCGVKTPENGFLWQPNNPGLHAYAAKDNSQMRGIFIKKVYKNSNADFAGMKEKDILISVNGKDVTPAGEVELVKGEDYKVDFTHEISQMKNGDKIAMKVLRNGKVKNITYTKNANSCRYIEPAYFPVDQPKFGLLGGMLVQDLNMNLVQAASKYNPEVIKYVYTQSAKATDTSAVLVSHVFGGTISSERSAAPFQIIKSMNGKKVTSLQDLAEISSNLLPLNSVRFTDGTTVILTKEEMAKDAQVSCAQSFPVNRVLHFSDAPRTVFASKQIGGWMSDLIPACHKCGGDCDDDDDDKVKLICGKCKKHNDDEEDELDDLDEAIRGLEIHEANMDFQYCKDMSSSSEEESGF